MKNTILILGLLFSIVGYCLLWAVGGWTLCGAVLLITMGNNIDEKHKRGEYDKT